MAMTKRLWSLNALAVELDADRRTVANALKRVPADGEQAGHPAWFILTAIRAMWPAPDANGEILDPAQERARKDRALAIQTELKNDVAQGNVVLIDDVIREFAINLGVIRTQFLSLPSRARARFDPSKPAGLFQLLEELVHEILTNLSEPDQLEAVRDAERKHEHAARRGAASADRRRASGSSEGRQPDGASPKGRGGGLRKPHAQRADG
jgi:hypothetical protein